MLAPLTRTIVALNVAWFIVQLILAGDLGALWRMPSHALLAAGGNYAIATIADHRWETLVTACFVHADLLHIGFNMVALWQAGPLVEHSVGSARMAPMYLLAGTTSSLTSALVGWVTDPERQSVGASGAISGVIAAALVVGWRVQGWRSPLTQAMARWLAFVIGFGVLVGMKGGGIDNAAHIGGAVAGAVIAALWQRGYVYSPAARNAILAVCGAVVAASAFVVASRDISDPNVTLRAPERLERFANAMRAGRCDEASASLRSVERLYPRERLVLQARREFESLCGRPM